MPRQYRKREAVVVTPSGARCVRGTSYCLDLVDASLAYVLEKHPLVVRVISDDYHDELWRANGRIMSGVTRDRLNAKPSSSASPGRVKPPRPVLSDDERDFRDYKSQWVSRSGGLIVENS